MRGGTSKGLYFSATDLPQDEALRNTVLLAILGSPDARQIDGMGGAHPLTSKVAVLSAPSRADADIDYLFLQVAIDSGNVTTAQNCGNILAGVGPWAIENGYVNPARAVTQVRIHMCNSSSLAVAAVQTPGGVVSYCGEANIDGVPGSAAPITIDFLDVAGSSCGALLPTGSVRDREQGIDISCVDNGMPVVLLRAADVGKTGYETPAELEADTALTAILESIRLAVGERMNLGDVSKKSVPKMCLLAPPAINGAIATRTFIPHRVHEAIGVLGAVTVATACLIPGSVAQGIAVVENVCSLKIEHPSGFFTVSMDVEQDGNLIKVNRSALLRTARKLMQGDVFCPAELWPGHCTVTNDNSVEDAV